jgi:hypothetical protein
MLKQNSSQNAHKIHLSSSAGYLSPVLLCIREGAEPD